MPNLEFRCTGAGRHAFERFIPLSQFDFAQQCPACGAVANQEIRTAPAMSGFDTPAAKYEASIYRSHNITRGGEVEPGVNAEPVSASMQCQCGDCSSHRKRNPITETAEPGKVV